MLVYYLLVQYLLLSHIKHLSQFQLLASILFREQDDLITSIGDGRDGNCHSQRSLLFDKLSAFFPESMTQPRRNLAEQILLWFWLFHSYQVCIIQGQSMCHFTIIYKLWLFNIYKCNSNRNDHTHIHVGDLGPIWNEPLLCDELKYRSIPSTYQLCLTSINVTARAVCLYRECTGSHKCANVTQCAKATVTFSEIPEIRGVACRYCFIILWTCFCRSFLNDFVMFISWCS